MAEGLIIEIHDVEFKFIDYRKIKTFQGNLKELSDDNYNKLRSSLENKGFFAPVFVWDNNGTLYFLDGHARSKVLNSDGVTLKKDGKTTYKIPAVVIKAESINDAKEKLLIISSQYHTITDEGYKEFTSEMDAGYLRSLLNYDAIIFQEDYDLELPDELIGTAKEKDPVIKITFKNPGDLEKAEQELKPIINKYEGAFYSITANEV